MAIRQCRARAPSMTSTPWSSAAARVPSVRAVSSAWTSTVASATSESSARRQPPNGSRTQASAPIRAAPCSPSFGRRRRVRQPAEVAARAVAGQVDAADRATVDLARQVQLDARRRAGGERRVARRRLLRRASRAETGRRRRPVPEGELVGHRDGGERGCPRRWQGRSRRQSPGRAAAASSRSPPAAAGQSRSRRTGSSRTARAPTGRPPRPTAGASGHRAGRAGWRRRRSRAPGAAANRGPARPSRRRLACPCVAGGQARPARAMATGNAAAIPTTRSTGPPGR